MQIFFKHPTYLLTFLRGGTICLDFGRQTKRSSLNFPAEKLRNHLSQLPPGDCAVLDDLNDPIIQSVSLPGVSARQGQSMLSAHWSRFAPESPWRLIIRDRHRPGYWLLHRLEETSQGERAQRLRTLSELGHRICALFTPAQILSLVQAHSHPATSRWRQLFSHTQPASNPAHIQILPTESGSLLTVTRGGCLQFSRHVQDSTPDQALQAVLPTLYAHQMLAHHASIKPTVFPPTESLMLLRTQLLQGKYPSQSFLPQPRRGMSMPILLLSLTLVPSLVWTSGMLGSQIVPAVPTPDEAPTSPADSPQQGLESSKPRPVAKTTPSGCWILRSDGMRQRCQPIQSEAP